MKYSSLFAIVIFLLLIGCKKNVDLATLTTNTVSDINVNSATSGGTITSTGNGTISSRGVCWSTSPNPSIEDNHSNDGTGTGSYVSNLIDLSRSEDYYVRAYAANEAGIAYGDQLNFKTLIGTLSDAEGNEYKLVKIGDQIWMAENLMTTKYNDGTPIPLLIEDSEWIDLSTPGYCWYNNNYDDLGKFYGALYNWYTVNTGKLCPIGSHPPTDDEWSLLVDLTDSNLTEAGFSDSYSEGGFRRSTDGTFHNLGYKGYWWSSTSEDDNTAWIRSYNDTNDPVGKWNFDKKWGISVRCIVDNK